MEGGAKISINDKVGVLFALCNSSYLQKQILNKFILTCNLDFIHIVSLLGAKMKQSVCFILLIKWVFYVQTPNSKDFKFSYPSFPLNKLHLSNRALVN